MASFEDKLAFFEDKINLLNEKMDKILFLLEKPNKQLEKTWSICDYNIKGIDYFLKSASIASSLFLNIVIMVSIIFCHLFSSQSLSLRQ